MEDSINTVKFAPGTLARKHLMQTGDLELIHLSGSDFFWGQNRKGDGKNLLGKALMHMRNSDCDCSVVLCNDQKKDDEYRFICLADTNEILLSYLL